MSYIERQSGERLESVTHWLPINPRLHVLSVSASEVEASETYAPGYTPASLFDGVFYLCDKVPA